MAATPLSFRWESGFVERIDRARGTVPRSKFVRTVLEQHLATGPLDTREPPEKVSPGRTPEEEAELAAIPDEIPLPKIARRW